MADRTIPAPTSGRVTPAPEPSPSPGGGGNAVEWVDLPLDPTDSVWTVLGASPTKTAALVNGNLEVDLSSPANYKIRSSTNNGLNLVTTLPVMPWSNHSGGVPAGTAAHTIQPESSLLKVRVEFDSAHGPTNGSAADAYGFNMMCVAGFTSYPTDQAGSPTVGGAGVEWRGAMVRKFKGDQPSISSVVNVYKAGIRTYHTDWIEKGDYLWSNQQGAGPTAHDSIVYMSAMVLRQGDTVTARSQTTGGSYCSADPFGPMNAPVYGFSDGATVMSNTSGSVNSNYFHIWIGFGSTANFAGGTFKVTKISYSIQPLASRVPV